MRTSCGRCRPVVYIKTPVKSPTVKSPTPKIFLITGKYDILYTKQKNDTKPNPVDYGNFSV